MALALALLPALAAAYAPQGLRAPPSARVPSPQMSATLYIPEQALAAAVGIGGTTVLAWSVYFRAQFEGLQGLKRRLFKEHVQGSRVLEVGIGRGRNVELLWAPGRELVGLDPVKNPYLSTTRVSKVVTGVAEDMPFEDASFDAVVCEKVFCNVKDPERALREVARVLKPGGSFVFVEHVGSEDALVRKSQELAEHRGHLESGHHLCRDTDKLFRRHTAGGDKEPLFAQVLSMEPLDTLSMWPEVPHVLGALRK